MIKTMTHTDLTDETFQWGEHVWFDLPLEGAQAALEARDNHCGYGFLAQLFEELEWLDVSDFPAHSNGVHDVEAIGDIVDYYEESLRVTFHGVYTHSLALGYYARYYSENHIQDKLDAWWDAHETDVVWPMRAVRFGAGAQTRYLHENNLSGNVMPMESLLAPMAASAAEFGLFWTD